MMTGIASNDGATAKMDSRARASVTPAGPPGANVQTTPGAPNASPMVPSGVMPPFYGNPGVVPPGVPPTGLADPGGFLPGRDRFPNPMWQQHQQQTGAEANTGWGASHFQPPPNQLQPHMEFHQQQGMYQGYQPTGYAPPFDYPQDQRAGYGVQQFASTRAPSSPARYPQQIHTPQPSPNNPTVNGINGRGPLNNGQYVDSSPSSASSGQYVNGTYSSNPSQQDSSMTQGSHPPSASPAPPGRNSSAGSVYDSTDTGSSQGKPNGPQAGNNNNFSSTTSTTTGHPNGVPGYPLPRPQLSSLNSSGYSGNVSVVGDQHPPPGSPCWGAGNGGVEQQSWGEQARSQQQQQHQQQQQQQQSPPPGGGVSNGVMFSGQQREQLNTRLKSMILNKQQHQYQQYGQFSQYMPNESQMISPSPNAYSSSMRENGNENGPNQQHPPESAPDFLVQGPPQAASEGGLWDWVEGTNSNNAARIGLNRGRNATSEDQFVSPADLPGDVKDFLTGNSRNTPTSKANWHSPAVDRATAVETGIFSSPVSKPKLAQQEQQQQQQQNLQTDNKSDFHKQIGINTQQPATFPELELGANATYPTFPTKQEGHMKVTVKQESLFPFETNTSCAQETKPAVAEMKKERMDVASYLDQQKAAERNKRWSPTPPPPPPHPPQANDFNKRMGGLSSKEYQDQMERLKNNVRAEIPDCNCFPADKSSPPEPGSFYTHLGTAASLADLRKDIETRVGIKGKELRFEKICYTGKEGKTQQGCPLAKWIIRRSSLEEKILCVVKHRQGHKCSTAWIVVVLVAWEGVPSNEAGRLYGMLTDKMNRFGLPTTRRCATNEPRTCACQGLDPDTCGASFSFGCSWSMYYNGCKYARSKTVRKFRLSVRSEEQEVEERMHVLATLLSPLYRTIAPEAFNNQVQFEREAMECRLGFKPGRPFSGVTACMDFCAHSHRDLHNMNNGCTVVVSLTRHRTLGKPDDEQLHVLPLYIMDDTDEFGSKEGQQAKVKSGAIENLSKFPCEVRVRSVPLQPCRRHGKKRKEDEPDAVIGKNKDLKGSAAATAAANNAGPGGMHIDVGLLESMEAAQLQSSQVSSTVLDSPVSMYQGWGQTDYHDPYWGRSWGAAGQDCKNPNWWGDMLGEMKVDADSTTGMMRYAQYSPSNSASSPHHPSTPQSGGPFVFPPSWQQSSAGLYQSQSQPSTPSQPSNNWPNSDQTPKSRKSTDDSSQSPFMSPASGGTTTCHQEQTAPVTPPAGFATPQAPPTENNSLSCLQQQQNKLPERSMSVPLPVGHPNRYPDRPQSQSWDYASPSPPSTPANTQSQATPPSPFRIPKARPPSRSNTMHQQQQPQPQQQPQQQQQQQQQQQSNLSTGETASNPTPTYCKGFLKPYPPTSQANMQTARESWPLEEQLRPEEQQNWYGTAGKPEGTGCNMKQDAWSEENKLGGYPPQAYGPSGYPNAAAGNGASATVHGGNPFAALNNYSYSNTFMPPCNLFPDKSYGSWNDASYMNYYHQQQIMGEFAKRDERAACYHTSPFMYQQGYPKWDPRFEFCPPPHHPFFPMHTEPPIPRSEPIGKVVEICDNEECFKDSQMGGVAIALGHGSVLFECAKQELHCTTALRRPNRLRPARISLVFYQHRNLNRARHGWDEWEEKMRLRKLGVTAAANASAANAGTSGGGNSTGSVAGGSGSTSTNTPGPASDILGPEELMLLERPKSFSSQFLMRAPTCTTNTVTTLFPMHPCMVTGPYQEGGAVG